MSIAVVCMVNSTALKELEGGGDNNNLNDTTNSNCVAEASENNNVY